MWTEIERAEPMHGRSAGWPSSHAAKKGLPISLRHHSRPLCVKDEVPYGFKFLPTQNPKLWWILGFTFHVFNILTALGQSGDWHFSAE